MRGSLLEVAAMNKVQEAARRFMEKEIPDGVKSKIAQMSGVPVSDGSTYHDHLNAKVMQMAKAGDKQAQKLAKQYGLTGSDDIE